MNGIKFFWINDTHYFTMREQIRNTRNQFSLCLRNCFRHRFKRSPCLLRNDCAPPRQFGKFIQRVAFVIVIILWICMFVYRNFYACTKCLVQRDPRGHEISQTLPATNYLSPIAVTNFETSQVSGARFPSEKFLYIATNYMGFAKGILANNRDTVWT